MAAIKKRGRPKRQWYQKLKRLMAAMQVSGADLGEVVGLARSTVNKKLAGQIPWQLDEAYRVLDFLGVEREMIYLYFPYNGEDVDEVQHQYVREYLEETDQMLVSRTVVATLETLVGGMATGAQRGA